jgi:hypothetical protein
MVKRTVVVRSVALAAEPASHTGVRRPFEANAVGSLTLSKRSFERHRKRTCLKMKRLTSSIAVLVAALGVIAAAVVPASLAFSRGMGSDLRSGYRSSQAERPHRAPFET